MTVGFAITQASMNQLAGQLVFNVRESLRLAAAHCDLLNDTGIFPNDTALTALGFTAGEVTLYRASFTDLKTLYNVSHGLATVPGLSDFFSNAKKLTGTS